MKTDNFGFDFVLQFTGRRHSPSSGLDGLLTYRAAQTASPLVILDLIINNLGMLYASNRNNIILVVLVLHGSIIN
jgi:hypothetical protein